MRSTESVRPVGILRPTPCTARAFGRFPQDLGAPDHCQESSPSLDLRLLRRLHSVRVRNSKYPAASIHTSRLDVTSSSECRVPQPPRNVPTSDRSRPASEELQHSTAPIPSIAEARESHLPVVP